jgi:ATP/maltotriose-dependent transcriptional regulator MalT
MTADAGGYRGFDPTYSAGAFSALVLGGAPIVRAGIAYLLQREYAGHARVETAEWESRERALAAGRGRLDLVVAWTDSDMGADACFEFASAIAGTGIIVVTPPAGSEPPVGRVRNGLVSIPYGAPLPLWRKALQLAARRARARARRPVEAGEAPLAPLTERQREVLEMLQMGLSNKHIANRLSLSVGTVKLHVAAVLRATQAKNRINLVLRRAAALNAQRIGDDGLA